MEFKIKLIKEIFKKEIESKHIIIIPFYEEGIIDTSYGDKVLKIAKEVALSKVDYIIYGSDKNIDKCFGKEAKKSLHQVKINREEVNISATKIRECLKNNDDATLKSYLNPSIYANIDKIKDSVTF